MNKGRNVLLLMVTLLCISVLAFFTLFERNNTNGVANNVRYIVENDEDGSRTYSFYYTHDGSNSGSSHQIEGGTELFIDDGEYADYIYFVSEDGKTITATDSDGNDVSDKAFDVYSKTLVKMMANGKDKFLKFYQALIVFAIIVAGGAVIMYAEELWHIIHKKGEDVVPKWSDMNGVKLAGAGIIALGVAVLVMFILI